MIVESVMAMVAVACVVLNLIVGDVLGFVLAMFWTCAQMGLVVIGFDLVRKERTHLDLREVYPPKRDRFHRDLERLNKLRGNVATKLASAPLPDDSYVQMPEAVMEALREERESELRESNQLHRVFAAGISLLVPFLIIALYGAMIGLLVSLL